MTDGVWFTPEEKTPPLNKPVLMEIKTKFGYLMHCYGFFGETGWETLRDIGEYVVHKWRFFIEG